MGEALGVEGGQLGRSLVGDGENKNRARVRHHGRGAEAFFTFFTFFSFPSTWNASADELCESESVLSSEMFVHASVISTI